LHLLRITHIKYNFNRRIIFNFGSWPDCAICVSSLLLFAPWASIMTCHRSRSVLLFTYFPPLSILKDSFFFYQLFSPLFNCFRLSTMNFLSFAVLGCAIDCLPGHCMPNNGLYAQPLLFTPTQVLTFIFTIPCYNLINLAFGLFPHISFSPVSDITRVCSCTWFIFDSFCCCRILLGSLRSRDLCIPSFHGGWRTLRLISTFLLWFLLWSDPLIAAWSARENSSGHASIPRHYLSTKRESSNSPCCAYY